MRSTDKIAIFVALGFAFTSGAAALHADENAPSEPVPAGHSACWKQAGISKDVMQQRKSIATQAKSQVAAVQNDSSLTPRQQEQQIRQIRLSTRQQEEKLITPEQQQALRQCRRDQAGASTPAANADQG